MDLMEQEPWRSVVIFLCHDQGDDFPIPGEFEYKPGRDRDIVAAERYLGKLCLKFLIDFCCADQDDINRMIRAGGEDAKRAHEIVDDIYLLIIGEEP